MKEVVSPLDERPDGTVVAALKTAEDLKVYGTESASVSCNSKKQKLSPCPPSSDNEKLRHQNELDASNVSPDASTVSPDASTVSPDTSNVAVLKNSEHLMESTIENASLSLRSREPKISSRGVLEEEEAPFIRPTATNVAVLKKSEHFEVYIIIEKMIVE